MTAVSTILSEPEAAIDPVSLPQWQADSQLSIHSLSFDYGEKSVLKRYCIGGPRISKNWDAIGMSGSGKSTLINNLSGFLIPKERRNYF